MKLSLACMTTVVVVVVVVICWSSNHAQAINLNRRQGAKKNSLANGATTTSKPGGDETANVQKLSLPHVYSQIQSLSEISKKMLKRLQMQNEEADEKLNECYNQLGKHTRMMIVNNKRRALKDLSSTSADGSGLFDNQSSLNEERGGNLYLGGDHNDQSIEPSHQLNMNSITLHRDLNYYLLESFLDHCFFPLLALSNL